MMNIIAIGGGEKTPAVTHALELTGDQKPSVLLLPSACSTPNSFGKKVAQLETFFNDIGVETRRLHEYGEQPTATRIAEELGRASMFYTIGGNSPYMLRTMHEHGTDHAVADAIKKGKVHAGTSAGALLPFELGHSNVAARPTETEWDYEYLDMLGITPGVATAHADQHDPTPYGQRNVSRLDALVDTFPRNIELGYAIDNGAALVIQNDQKYVIRANLAANVHVISAKDNITIEHF